MGTGVAVTNGFTVGVEEVVGTAVAVTPGVVGVAT